MRITPTIMFTNTIRKIASKMLMLGMLFSTLAPLATSIPTASAAPLTGNLSVGFDHASGGFTVTNGNSVVVADKDSGDCPLQANGYFTCNMQLETGPYQVVFKDVPGFVTPDNVIANLSEVGVNIQSAYQVEGGPSTGELTIGFDNAQGGFTLTNGNLVVVADKDGADCAFQAGYFKCNFTLETGPYRVEFKDVPNYKTPSPVILHLSSQGGSVLKNYIMNGPLTGELQVGVNNAQGGYTITNGNSDVVADKTAADCGALQPNGYFICSHTLETGPYRIEFKAVPGYITPDDIVADLSEVGGAVFGTYMLIGPSTGNLGVGVNNVQGGYTITNGNSQVVANKNATDCALQPSGYYVCQQNLATGPYVVKFKPVTGYITPSDIVVDLSPIGGTVYGYYAMNPTGAVEVKVVNQNNEPILNLPANEWQLKKCTNANPATCADVIASGGAGTMKDGLGFDTYRIVFPSPALPAGYTGRTVIPSVYQELNSGATYLLFTIKYTKQAANTGTAYVNVRTTPVKAHVRMVTSSPAQPDQNRVTGDLVNAVPTYDLSDPDRFTLPTTAGGVTASTNYYIQCLPAPGGYHAPANPIQVNGAVYNVNSENLAGTCQYTQTPANERVQISIDTIGIEKAAIRVDGVEVRATNDDAETFVWITTTEDHSISFEDKDPTHFTKPVDIAIPAGSLNSNMTPAQLKYLGYYVALGNLATAEVNTQNQNGWVYLTVGADPTLWNVGYATTDTLHPLIVHFDETVNHTFNFQDRNAPANPVYFLRAMPVSYAGFSVAQNIQMNGSNVTYFQERYVYSSPHALTTVHLVGDYIAQTNAAFFRARTTNADPVFGNIMLDINNEPVETLRPGAQTWTRTFISDVVNDSDNTNFESPITVNAITYTASPLSFDLSTYNPGPLVNDLESTYITGGSTHDLTVQLVSLDPLIQPTPGLTVTLDTTVNALTVNNAGSIEAGFTNLNAAADHTVHCPDFNAGLVPPNDIVIPAGSLQLGQNTVQCIYAPITTAAEIQIRTTALDNLDLEAPITLTIDGVDYNIGSTVSSNPLQPATLNVYIDSALTQLPHTTVIHYGDVVGYITPAPANVVNIAAGTNHTNPSNVFTGVYTHSATGATLNFHLRELDPDLGPVANTNVTVNVTTQQSNASGDTSFAAVPVNQNVDVTFGNHPLGTGAYATPLPLHFDPNQLVSGHTYDFYVYYVPVGNAVTLDIRTLDEPTQLINVDGQINLLVNNANSTLLGFGTASVIVSNSAQFSYDVDWGPALVAGYIEPAVDPLHVDVTSLAVGQHRAIDGLYRVCASGNCETVTITAWDGANILTTADISINGTVVSTNGQYTGSYDVGTVLDIAFEILPGYGVPEIRVNHITVGNHYTQMYTVMDAPSPNTVDAYYSLGNSVGFNVGTRDNQNNPLTQNITHGATGVENTAATPAQFAVAQASLNAYTIRFTDRPGYITPGSVVVVNQAIASIPANVTIMDNGVAYVPGTQLVLGDTYDIVGTYIPYLTIEKNITNEQTITGNNKRVDYQIVVTRHPSSPAGAMSITLQDTIAPSRTLTGSNGGTMTVVPQGGSYSVCSNACGDITAGSVTVPIDNPGASVTITYQLLSNNSGIPTGGNSNFTNTLTGNFTYNSQAVQLTDTAVVNVLAAPTSGNNNNPGGGGGGGGAVMIKGDMILEVTKLVSLDNKTWVDASDETKPLNIPSRVDSTLFTKVKVKNLGQVTATNIKYSEGFDEGDSKITTDDIQNVKGDPGMTFTDATNKIMIDKLTVGQEINFTYEQILHEDGSKGELAEEYLMLDGFSTKLGANQDGLTKHGIGDHYPSWLVAGNGTGVTSGDLLQLTIKTDKAAARIGEEVTYTITAKNNADFDFTGLVLTWAYDKNALEILNPFGGRDTGNEIHWNQGILRPNETVSYTVRTRVKSTAPVGGNVRTTARGLVNEIENPSVVDHYLTIIAGVSSGPVNLAQTGASTFGLLLVSVLAYLAYANTGKRRYLALKKAALRPL